MLLALTASLGNSCASASECERVNEQNLLSYGRSFPSRPSKYSTCDAQALERNLAAARTMQNATAIANAFVASCKGDLLTGMWSPYEADGYFNVSWLPGEQSGGVSCTSMTRFGPPWQPCPSREKAVHGQNAMPKQSCVSPNTAYKESKFAQMGDGGKTVCEAASLLGRPGCVVVSVGINANTEFEEALHAAHPRCRILGYDGTLSGAKRTRAATRVPFLELHDQNFGPAMASNFSTIAPSIRLLKIDCDGCEFATLPVFVSTVCTDQIVVEVHRTLRHKPRTRVRLVHDLFVELNQLYRVAYLETNPVFPWLGTEYTLIRRSPCP